MNIIRSLFTSFSQITIGLAEARPASVFCLSIALGTAFLLACSVYLMLQNFNASYRVWEEQAQQVLDKHWDESVASFHASNLVPVIGELPVKSSTVIGDGPKSK